MKIQSFRWSELSDTDRSRILRRSQRDIAHLEAQVAPIINDVRARGDAALLDYATRFDGADLSQRGIPVAPWEFDEARERLDADLLAALDYAIENVRRFHATQIPERETRVEVRPGIIAGERHTPIERVGLYVPCGRGSFPSMVYMLAVPATLAKVPTIAIVTPPLPDGTVDPSVLYAAERCGVTRVFRCGGSQAIAALAYGTESVPSVYKVVGPGSAYVAAAKRVLSDRLDVGVPAGPSESIVVADESADTVKVALDVMIEAEHGSDSAALLVTTSEKVAQAVEREIALRVPRIPAPRRDYLESVFANYGGIILTENEDQSVEVVNTFAPEHLLLHTQTPRDLSARITNASEVLLGPHTAFSLANYATGPNAILPTGGWAKSFGR